MNEEKRTESALAVTATMLFSFAGIVAICALAQYCG